MCGYGPHRLKAGGPRSTLVRGHRPLEAAARGPRGPDLDGCAGAAGAHARTASPDRVIPVIRGDPPLRSQAPRPRRGRLPPPPVARSGAGARLRSPRCGTGREPYGGTCPGRQGPHGSGPTPECQAGIPLGRETRWRGGSRLPGPLAAGLTAEGYPRHTRDPRAARRTPVHPRIPVAPHGAPTQPAKTVPVSGIPRGAADGREGRDAARVARALTKVDEDRRREAGVGATASLTGSWPRC